MPQFEYKVIPAPAKGLKGKGIKGPEARFSHALEELMNRLAHQGWEYQRAETLPSLERSGLTSTTTEWRNVLVFRRLRETAAEAFAPELLAPPRTDETMPPEHVATKVDGDIEKPSVEETPPDAETAADTDDKIAPAKPRDNGVEDTDDVEGVGSSLEQLAASRNLVKSEDQN